MSYRRVLLLVELGSDARLAAAAIRRVAPGAEYLLAVAQAPGPQIAWLSRQAPAEHHAAATESLEALRAACAGLALRVEAALAAEVQPGALAARAAHENVDLLVSAALPPVHIPLLAELRKRLGLPLLWTAGAEAREGPIREIQCLAFGDRARRAVAGFLRDHAGAGVVCTVVGPAIPEHELAGALGVAGISARVEFATAGALRLRVPDLYVVPRLPGALLAMPRPAPLLVLPPLPPPRPGRRTIDASDAVDLGEPLRIRITYAAGVGRLEPIPDQEIALVSAGRTVACARSEGGFVEAEIGGAAALGVFRTADAAAGDAVPNLEQVVAVIRPGPRPLALFDAEMGDEEMPRLSAMAGACGVDLLAVRLRPVRSCASIRARLASLGLLPRVADASAVLDEGAALDVPAEVDPVRLARVAARMRGTRGFPVAAIVHRGSHTPSTVGFPALRVDAAPAAAPLRFDPPARITTLSARLDATTGAAALPGNRIEPELDNPTARAWLLDAIAGARHRVHVQVYMAADDGVGSRVEAALGEAAARGVAVRVLVDSLHGLQGSFGLRNPLLARLGARENVELLVAHPIAGAPTLEDLKQRDHRKLVVVDGAVALVGGRNLSDEYYTGFDEVALRTDSLWREVPWLDAGVRVAGPAVEAVERSFLEAWTGAGGAPFAIEPQPPAGAASARVVVHRGLRDAATLEAYLALIDSARSHVYLVNGFPLLLELQRALLRAIAGGVRVRALVGHTTPTHGETPFKGPWSTAREAASALVDSRLDALVAAGGEVYRFAVRGRPRWAPELGTVHPHVHAKVVTADGRVSSVGSANLDVTAGYWENELVLVMEDEAVTRAIEARLDELIAGSERIDDEDPAWRRSARQRTWMRRWPGVLSV